jgi:hypothetical protein
LYELYSRNEKCIEEYFVAIGHTITITLPDSIYERVKVTAQEVSLLPEDEQRQRRFAELAEVQKRRSLHPDEQMTLEQLMHEAEQIMLSKAEAYRVLAQRGHSIFPPTDMKQTS